MFLNSSGFPYFQRNVEPWLPFVFNEGGRGFTLSVYRKPFCVRVYLAGRAWSFG
jgi:hypothetical protein